MSKSLNEIINESKFGVFTERGFETGNNNKWEIERDVKEISSGVLTKIKIKNISDEPVKVYSLLVSDVLLSSDMHITEALENSWIQNGKSAFKNLNKPTKKNILFLKADQNPFSFEPKYGHLKKSIVSEWYSVLRSRGESFFFGAITIENQFSQVYVLDNHFDIQVRLTSQYDGLTLDPGKELESETFFVSKGNEAQIKKQFASLLAKQYKIDEVAKPISALCIGYYWNSNYITESIVNDELDRIEAMDTYFNLDYIQLDAGYSDHFGVSGDYQKKFPNGLQPVFERIKRMGYKVGLWVAPVLVSHESEVHKNHKSWLLHTKTRKHLKGLFITPFDKLITDINVDILDPTREVVIKYIKDLFISFVNMGVDLFKVDFIYTLLFSDNYSKKMTRAQSIRSLLRIIREVIGKDRKILTAMSPLSSVVGIADYVRTGMDSAFPKLPPLIRNIVNNYMFRTNLESTFERSFLNGIVWRADPDTTFFENNHSVKRTLLKRQVEMIASQKMNRWVGEKISQVEKNSLAEVLKFVSKE